MKMHRLKLYHWFIVITSVKLKYAICKHGHMRYAQASSNVCFLFFCCASFKLLVGTCAPLFLSSVHVYMPRLLTGRQTN
uniref:Uncharacterized protein n=1 Tax=Rhipicephalus microplus TaxID=6941 RepID=A0A6M2DEE6_RHIMP